MGLDQELGQSHNQKKGEEEKYEKKLASPTKEQVETEREKGNKSELKSIRFENYVREKLKITLREFNYYPKYEKKD